MEAQLATLQEPHERLTQALRNTLGMQAGDASEVAQLVLLSFNGDEELHDDELTTDLRSMFYTIEEQKLLDFRREEYKNDEGHLRRAFYWTIRWDNVEEAAQHVQSSTGSNDSVYDELPHDAWNRATLAS